jgi:hypothetical protein
VPAETRTAAKVAYAPRGQVKLASVVREDVPELWLATTDPEESPKHRALMLLLLGPGPLMGLLGMGAVAGLLLSQRRRGGHA